MATNPLSDISTWRFRASGLRGIPSICSAHPVVIEAAMRHAARLGLPVLIEATCNQVNQDGGYTGMTPDLFVAFVKECFTALRVEHEFTHGFRDVIV